MQTDATVLRLRALHILCLVIATWASATTAHAQMIQASYPKDVPGFDTQAGVSVTSRIQQDTEWQQILVGSDWVHPEVTESISHDSAVLVGRKPSWIESTAPSVTVTSTDGGSTDGAYLAAQDNRYLAAPHQSDTDWTAAIGGTVDVADCKLTLAAAHLSLHELDTALDALPYDAPLPFSVDTLRFRGESPVGRLTVQPSLGITHFTFGNASIDGISAPQSYRDRLVTEGEMSVFYGIEGFNDPDRAVLILRGNGGSYPNDLPSQPPRDFVGGAVLAGVEHDLDGLWGWRLVAGIGGRTYRDPIYANQLVPVAEGTVTWQPTERTTFHAGILRKIEDASDIGVGSYVATVLGIAMDHEVQRNLILHAGLDLDRAQYGGASETFLTGSLGLLWLISRNFRANGTINLTSHQSTGASSYGENVFLLSLTAGI
jgi:hypothetical protein